MKNSTEDKQNVLSRRHFITLAGGATFVIAAGTVWSQLKSDPPGEPANSDQITAWVRLQPNGQVIIYNPAAEMGQGSMTALAVLIAEEMDVDWSDVHIEFSPIEPTVYGVGWGGGLGGSMITVGSRTVRSYYQALRQAGAQARYVLLHSVAEKWNVPMKELTTKPSIVVHRSSGREITYGEISNFIKSPESIPQIPEDQLKQPAQFRLIGKNIPRFDLPAKVDGTAIFSIDVHPPEMVYGVVSRSPVNGARPNEINESTIRAIPGVIDMLVLDYGVGIVADSWETASKAKRELQIQWSDDSSARTHRSDDAYNDYLKMADSNTTGRIITDKLNVTQALSEAVKTYKVDYFNDYAYHAQMEPLNAVVSVAPDGASAEAWVGSQAPDGARSEIASILGIDISKVTFHPCYLGGGFGRRSMADYVSEATILSKAVKKPVKLIWTREDDVQYGAFRPQSLQRMQAGVDANGSISAWWHIISGTGGGLLTSGVDTPFYDLPCQKIELRGIDHGVRTKHWRSVGHGPNKWAIEAFIDEIAVDLGKDPYTFRQQLMKDSPRALKVLDTAASMSRWGTDVPDGRARGIAFAERSGSLSAGVCELSVDRQSGMIRIHHIWTALDAGVVVQPDNAVAQMEGAVLFGLSSVLSERISFMDGRVQQSNYHDYPILRIADAPETLEVEIVPSHEPPSGIGEAGLPVVGGMVANAFAKLTGKKIRHMPFTPDRVLAALQT